MNFGSPLLAAFANVARRPPPPPPSAEPVDDQPAVEEIMDPAEHGSEPDTDPSTPTEPGLPARRRRLQCVVTKGTKIRVLKWMQEQFDQRGTDQYLMRDTLHHFPEVFRAESKSANFMKVQRWWRDREGLFADFEWDTKSMSQSDVGWRKRVELKACPSRGRKVSAENAWLYLQVRTEFERLRRSGVKFSPGVLLLMTRNVLMASSHPTFGPSSVVGNGSKTFLDCITTRWVQQFQESQGIMTRAQTGKLSVSPEKVIFIERATAYHMGQLARGFACGELNEDLLENMDETHFVVNMDNGKTLGFRGDTEVKYADVVSGGIGITMVVKLTGGRAAKICTPMLIFQNLKQSYPIRGTPDNVSGVCYRSSTSSFMTSELLTEYYSEPRVSWADVQGRTKIQFIDNYPGHNVIPSCTEALARIKTQLRYFPANSTHLVQPCDSFVISKIKDAWRRQWDAKKMDLIAGAMWQGDGRDGTSGSLRNPGWGYFLQIAADCVRDVNGQTDRHGMSYARKAMIRCGLSLNVDHQWDVKQLTPELQEIIAKYKINFEGSTKGLTVAAPSPRQVRRPAMASGRGQGRADGNSTRGGAAGRSGGRVGHAGSSITLTMPAGEETHGVPAGIATARTVSASTSATNWVASRPGARAHRMAARQRMNAMKSSNRPAVQNQGPEFTVGESSGAKTSLQNEPASTPHGDAVPDAQGPESVDIAGTLDGDAVPDVEGPKSVEIAGTGDGDAAPDAEGPESVDIDARCGVSWRANIICSK